eukprot:5017978-Prymnesium_polylepis.1
MTSYQPVSIAAEPSLHQRARHWLAYHNVVERFMQLTVALVPMSMLYVVIFRHEVVDVMNFGGMRALLAPETQPTMPRALPDFRPAGCEWRPTRTAWFCRSTSEAGAPSFEGREAVGPIQCSGRTHAQLCASETLRTLMVGPFFSEPGQWHSMGASYDDMLERDDRVIGYAADVVNGSGGVVAYPPLHLHHIHVSRGDGVHWYETHGDYAMDPARGYWHALPNGYCDANRQPGDAARQLSSPYARPAASSHWPPIFAA